MSLDRLVVRETPFPDRMSWDLAEDWARGIPWFPENDPGRPEWPATPLVEADLSGFGVGTVLIKDESVNPTGSHKDRPVWELVALYGAYARGLLLKKRLKKLNGDIDSHKVPRISIITSGNTGKALSAGFQRYLLPPPKLLIDKSVFAKSSAAAGSLYADIYSCDLDVSPLSAEGIKRLTNNAGGIDLTSLRHFRPEEVFYDWLVHEVFNAAPNRVYLPYGSGRLFENFQFWQAKSLEYPDPRLQVSQAVVASISILGARPRSHQSLARMLACRFNPFTIFDDKDISDLKCLDATGSHTGLYRVSESEIAEAEVVLNSVVRGGPSAAAGLALYARHWREGRIPSREKVIVINTGIE